jgi:Ras-related protein Rab-8A
MHPNSPFSFPLFSRVSSRGLDIRTWHANIEQHASEGVNKILIGNKCDWDEKRAVTLEQGRQLADEFGLRFLETSAKDNEGVEEAFFTLARLVGMGSWLFLGQSSHIDSSHLARDIKTRLIDSQPDAAVAGASQAGLAGKSSGNVNVGQGQNQQSSGGCCS